MKSLVLAAAVCCAAVAAGASTLTGTYTGYYAIGDSLSDNGNLFRETGTPPLPYFNGRFSNGPVFSDYLAKGFVPDVTTRNYAYGGARAVDRGAASGPVVDLDRQINSFLGDAASGLGKRPVVSVWMGANDLLGALSENRDPFAAATNAANAVTSAVGRIATDPNAGVRDIVVLTLPDLGRTPQIAQFPKANPALTDFDRQRLIGAASGATAQFNSILSNSLNGFTAPGVKLTLVDTNKILSDAIANPSKFGLKDTTNACVQGANFCGVELAKTTLFFDGVHPNDTAHRAIADAVASQITVVPLPASLPMLAAGVVGFWAISRRRKKAIAA